MEKTVSRWLRVSGAALFLGVCGTVAQTQELTAPAKSPEAVATAPVMDRKQVSRMRGKLLYKKSQIRRLEKAVVATKGEVATKAAELERQRREMYVAAEPRLAVLYEDQDQLEVQIREAADSLKKK